MSSGALTLITSKSAYLPDALVMRTQREDSPSTDWQEVVPGDEIGRFSAYAKTILAMQEGNKDGPATSRGLHVKRHVGAKAKFEVLADLPVEARVGIFANPGTFDAWVRFSNGAPASGKDKTPDVRGLAIKVLNVPGEKLLSGKEDETTQDFSLIQGAAVSFGNADGFMFFTSASKNPLILVLKSCFKFGLAKTIRILGDLWKSISQVVPSLAAIPYWSALPIRFGDYAVKYAAFPSVPANMTIPKQQPADLGGELKDRLISETISFDFCVQFYNNPTGTPIEDASIVWDENKFPMIRVAKLMLPRQNLHSEEGQRQEAYVESLAFNPWHAPIDFRPLGDLMRARGYIYPFSTASREAAGEPDKMVDFGCVEEE